jgi:inositol transport system substrate-binding protein
VGRPVIAIFLRSLDNDYQQRLRDEAVVAAATSAFDVEVATAENDAWKQIAQIGNAVARAGEQAADGGHTALLVSPVRDEWLVDLARAAVRAGLGWVILNREARYLDELRTLAPKRSIFSVNPDQTEIGRIMGRQVRTLRPGSAAVLCVLGPPTTSSANRRLEGMLSELADPGYEVAMAHADWTSEGARLAVETWLDGPGRTRGTPDIVVAQNDDMALGARQALRDAASLHARPELAQIPITGCDGSPTVGQRLVREGKLAATIVVPAASRPAVEWLERARNGERPPQEVVLPVRSFPELSRLRPP